MRKQKLSQLTLSLLVISLGLSFSLVPVSAAATASKKNQSPSENITQAVTQSYDATSTVQLGMIVQLVPKDASTVEPLTQKNISSMLGVVVSPNDATVTLSPQTPTQQQVFVATAGRYEVLVSNQNGSIQAGDVITVSSLAGIGMKADQSESLVLGKADSGFNGTTNVLSTQRLINSTGHSVAVSLGEIPVDLNIDRNPLISKETDYVPSFLAKTATAVSNKPVSAARIYLAMLTLLVTAILTGNLLYSGVRSGMQAIGRNPLSRKSIIRSLIQTVIAGLIIFVVGIFAVYLLLKL